MHSGVDVGGTFTDAVAWDGAELRVGKVATTSDQSDGVLSGIERVASGAGGDLLHGTTVATNALLERRGARTVLVTDAGYEDVIEIGRQHRPSLYDPEVIRPLPLVDRRHRIGIPGRSDPAGDRGGVGDLGPVLEQVADRIPESVAVSLLYSFADGSAENRVADALRERLSGIPVSVSSAVAREFREFERASTTLINAYLRPEVARYLTSLRDRASGAGIDRVAVMRSSGGLIPLEVAAELPASILLSGPAGGVVAATALGADLGHEHLISFDMGGTSTDVCRIDFGRPEVTYERSVDGLPCRMPAVAIHTVGAGGGSVAWVDPGGALRVGPRSSGALPGPACYGRGGLEPAVTDANLALGRIGSEARLAGTLALDADAATAALHGVGDRVGLSAAETALGVVEIVESHMYRAIRRVSIEEGADPRRAVLVAFGGAGGLHATALARRLDMAGVVVPAHAGVFSALGLLLAPPRSDAARSVLLVSEDGLAASVDEVAAEARSALAAMGSGGGGSIATYADVRYRGQSHETSVPFAAGDGWTVLAQRFHRAHEERNGFARPNDPIEVVTVRAEAVGTPVVDWSRLPAPVPHGEPRRADRPVLTPEGEVTAAGWWRPALAPGTEIVGPAVVEEPDATTYLAPGERAVVHDNGALEVSW